MRMTLYSLVLMRLSYGGSGNETRPYKADPQPDNVNIYKQERIRTGD